MPTSNQRSAETIADYERETSRLVAQCQRENPNDATWSPLLQTVHWFLNGHGRWAGNTIRLYANALEQEVGRMLEYDTFDPRSEEALLLRRLKTDRPSPKNQRTAEAIAAYERETSRLVAQYQRENPNEAPWSPLLQTVHWFLNGHARWAGHTIELYANALEQEVGRMLEFDTFDPRSEEALLLRRLKTDRPSPITKTKTSKKSKQVAHQKKVAAKTNKKKKPRKSIPVTELRDLVRYFRSREDVFSNWIAGYIILASRLGWRPGEMLMLQREGHFLRAGAEKHTNGRGLMDTCEIDIGAYFERSRLFKNVSLASEFDKWVADTRKWEAHYGGKTKLLDNINAHLARACEKRKIKRTCTYTFRHFAISCLKASGFSRAEIAVIVNHAADGTAAEHYGKRRDGFKRAKKILRFDIARLLLVRRTARKFDRSAALSKKSAKSIETNSGAITGSDETHGLVMR
jgi:hypothetical protein